MYQIDRIGYRPSKEEVDRIIIFIDHANVFHNLENLNVRIDYGKLKFIIAENRILVGAIIYMGLPKMVYPKKQAFLDYLKSNGFVIQKRPVKITANGKKKQTGIDVFLYRDMTELAEEDAYDKAILVSGDEDFVDAVLRLKQLGKSIEIWSFKGSLSQKLKKKAGEEHIHYLDDIIEKIKLH